MFQREKRGRSGCEQKTENQLVRLSILHYIVTSKLDVKGLQINTTRKRLYRQPVRIQNSLQISSANGQKIILIDKRNVSHQTQGIYKTCDCRIVYIRNVYKRGLVSKRKVNQPQ